MKKYNINYFSYTLTFKQNKQHEKNIIDTKSINELNNIIRFRFSECDINIQVICFIFAYNTFRISLKYQKIQTKPNPARAHVTSGPKPGRAGLSKIRKTPARPASDMGLGQAGYQYKRAQAELARPGLDISIISPL